MMINDIDKELINCLFGITKDKKFTEDIYDRLKTDIEKKHMIYYLKNCMNPSINDINRKALEIVGPRWKSKKY